MAYAPIVLYALSSMTQWFNYALVLFYITFLLGYQERRKGWLLMLCVLTIMLGALYRPMYCLLFLPLLLLYCRYQFNLRMIGFAIPALLLSVLCCYLAMQTAAPYASGFLYHLLRADNLHTAWRMLLSHTKSNLIDYFIRDSGSTMQTAFRWLYCSLTGLCLISSFIRTDKNGSRDITLEDPHLEYADLRLHSIDRDHHGQVIPIQEALLINNAETRRSLILEIIRQDPKNYIQQLQEACSDSDLEVSH